MTTVDALIVVSFIAYAVSAGFRNRRQASKNLEEYFLAGRTLPGWKAGLSMAATQFAADTPLLVTGLVATAGIFGLWQLWIFAATFLLMGFVLAGAWRRAGVVTDAELTEVRYGGTPAAVLRGVKAVYFGTIINCVALAWVLFAAATIVEPFLLWNEWLPPGLLRPVVSLVEVVGIPLTTGGLDNPEVWVTSANNLISLVMILTVTALYSATGGLRSVAATDVVQIGIMFLGTVAFTTIVVREVGGLSAMTDRVYEMFAAGGPGGILPDEILAFTPDQGKDVTLTVLSLLGLLWLINSVSDGSGYLAQRAMACRSDRDAKTAAVVFTFTQVLIRSLIWLPLGVGLLVLFPPNPGLAPDLLQADREATYVRGMAELLPRGVMGLMLTGMLAALASTVDTHLNWGASYWTNDIYKRFVCQAWLKTEPSGRALVWVARAANVLILVIALAIMTQLTSINQAWQINLLFGAGLGGVLVLRWLWWRMNAWAEIAAMVVSSLVAPPLMIYLDDEQQALRLLLAATVSTLAALAAIWVKGPEDEARLTSFYTRVRPVGFWGPVARAAGAADDHGPRRLWRALAAMVLCSLTVFCLLVGVGTWLVGSPPPVWLPSRPIWIGGLLLLGLALCPFWYRLGYGRDSDR
ncbi:MAG TPA: sodium:solute symporter family protein [Vicinamibacterales bacterium]|nr:sodium:solute symporter family protein [Vicinamibacterales bacterium]